MFDLLMSADMMLADPDGMAALLVSKLGIHGHPRWRQAFEDHPYIAHFLRVHKSLAIAPTRIEPQWHLDKPNLGDPLFHEHLEGLKAFQGEHRPMITHSVVLVLAKPRFEELVGRLMQRRLRFRLAQRTPDMVWDRLWLGVTPEDPRYEPSVDGGLCIEIMPIEPLQLPPEAFATPAPQLPNAEPGQMVRVTARGWLVRDLDDTLRRLSANLDWEPTGPVRELKQDGYRRATMGFGLANSATLDLVEPDRWDSDAGLYLNNWGPGPYYIRIGVKGLQAKADDLRARGTKFNWIDECEGIGGKSLIRVDPGEVRGQVFEFHEL